MHPCAAKTCAVGPVFAQVARELWAADPSKYVQWATRQILVQGHSLGLLDEAGSRGTSYTRARKPGQSAHAINPVGLFMKYPSPGVQQHCGLNKQVKSLGMKGPYDFETKLAETKLIDSSPPGARVPSDTKHCVHLNFQNEKATISMKK